eukprot:921668-Amphidinium_carterae.1
MELLEPSLVGLMKYVQGQATGGDMMASTILEECVASLELSKDKANPPPSLIPLAAGAAQEEEDEEMAGDEEPSAKKKRGMGAGTPIPSTPPADLPTQAGATSVSPCPADGAASGEAASGSAPTPAAAGAAAVLEEDIQAVLASVEAGEEWATAAKKKAGRPPKPPVMQPGALDKYVAVTTVGRVFLALLSETPRCTLVGTVSYTHLTLPTILLV